MVPRTLGGRQQPAMVNAGSIPAAGAQRQERSEERSGTVTTMTECNPRPMAVKDLRCGDMVHQVSWLGVDHWFTWGPARESYPVPGKWHVTKSGCGTHAVYASLDDVVTVCSTGHCGGPDSLCAYEHRPVYVADPVNPADEELAAAIQRSLELGTLVDADDWMARHAAELGR